jgi:hypothetical protein
MTLVGEERDARLGADQQTEFVVANLQQGLADLASLLVREVRRESWLDAYLLAAGMNQIAEDHLHPDVYPLDQAAEHLGRHATWLGACAKGTAAAVRAIRALRPAARWTVPWQRTVAQLVDSLADVVVCGRSPGARLAERALCISRDIAESPPALRRAIIRLPSCFKAFDQQPEDMGRLVDAFGTRWPRRTRPLVVVGVRTSGSYLAPLCAAFLRRDGWRRVQVLTVRPGRALLAHERQILREVTAEGGLALVVDDPPATGGSIARSIGELERAGVPRDSIVLLLPLFSHAPPAVLERFARVVLPRDEWAVEARLKPEAVARDLAALLPPGTSLVSVEPKPLASPGRSRGHRRALFRVRVAGWHAGPPQEEDVLVQGAGLGYFGTQVLAVARATRERSPRVHGLRGGLLYREWLPAAGSVDSWDAEAARSVAAHAADCRRSLAVNEDVSLRLFGEDAAWEVAAKILSRAFGRAWPVAKVLVVDRAARRLLRVRRPSVVDGAMGPGHWFIRDGASSPAVKAPGSDGAFSNVGLSCYDAAFDLAGATARVRDSSFAPRVRRAYADLGEPPVDLERWLLYELAHLWARERRHPEDGAELQRCRARSLQRYLASVYLDDVEPNASGPLCALDVDGVLETEYLGFPAMTPTAGLTLRALVLHGYRPVLATGRSLDEVAERCHVYRLAGGIAEYGAATYVTSGQQVRHLAPPGGSAARRLRAMLAGTDGVRFDEDYRFALRAYRVDARGVRRGLPSDTIAECLALGGANVMRAVPGEGQTDFVASDVDKGAGLRALAGDLLHDRPVGDLPFAFVVGDTVADIPCAALAEHAYTPAHANDALAAAGFEQMGAPYQAGLAQAARAVLGHSPGHCSVCRPPATTVERRLLLTLLAAPERGWRSMLVQGARLAWSMR